MAASVDATWYVVDRLGITFQLPGNFVETSEPDYEFSARSLRPQAFFSIYAESASITDFPPRAGETHHQLDLGAGGAVEIVSAAIEGLPEGIGANELLVSNGDQSFSVILSAPDTALDELWAVFIGSIRTTD